MKNPLPDNDFIGTLKRRNLPAFALLYDRYACSLLGLLCAMVNDQEVAETLLKQVFVVIWGTIPRYDPLQERLISFLVRTTRTVALAYLHTLERTSSSANSSVSQADRGNQKRGVISTKWGKIQKGTLSAELMQPLDVVFLKGCTQAEAARHLRLDLPATHASIRLAMSQLRQQSEVVQS